ncbi:MAG: MATE family efflux transporter [Firmicutes bacterium]|nr:MATE family efflux transporter [Bacillota bacterium]
MTPTRKQLNILDRNVPARALIFSLVIPSFIEELGQILTMYVDTAMVGRLGVAASAAIAVNHPIVMLTNGFNFGLAIGFSVMIARFIGEKHLEDAREVMRNAMFHILWFGGLLTVLYIFVIAPNFARWMNADPSIWADAGAYTMNLGVTRMFLAMLSINSNLLRGMGDTRRPMFCNILHNVVNVLFNYLLIYPTRTITLLGMQMTMIGAGRGVAGAAMGTSLANICSASLSMYFVLRKDNLVTFDRKRIIGFNGPLLRRTYRLGIPIALERLVLSTGQLATTRMLAGLGNTVVAAHSYANTAESVCYMPINGFGVAATTIVAQWLGAGDPKKAIELGDKCVKYACLVMAVCAVLMFIFAPQLIGVFTTDQQAISMASQALRVQAFAELFVAVANTVSGILRGAGDTKFSSLLSMIGMWGVRVPLAYILIHFFGFSLLGVWFPMALDWTMRCLLMTIRYKRGKWLNVWKPA